MRISDAQSDITLQGMSRPRPHILTLPNAQPSAVAEALQAQKKTIAQLAKEMNTSRAAIHRLLDENNDSLSLKTLAKAATVLGKRLRLELTSA